MKRLLFVIPLLGVSPSTAQDKQFEEAIARWTKQTGIVLTREARDRLADEIRGNIAAAVARDPGPSHTGVATATTGAGSTEATGSMASAPAGTTGSTGGRSGNSDVVVTAQGFEVLRSSMLRFEVLAPRLRRFPNIRVSVEPTPPRDYIVEINGDRYPPTEQGLYGVMPGVPISVRVMRPNKPLCAWAGAVQEGTEQPVKCQL